MPSHVTIPTQYFRAQMKLYSSRQMLFILRFYWHGTQNQNWKQKAHKTSPPKSVTLKSQHNIWTLPEPCWILQKQPISGFSCPFNLKKQIRNDRKWHSLWCTLTTNYQTGKRPRSKEWPGKYLKFNTNTPTHWRVAWGFP